IDLRRGRLVRGQPPSENCDCRVQISAHDLLRMLNGQLDFAQGFLHGKLRVTLGNQASAFKFLHLLIDMVSSTSTTSTENGKQNSKCQEDDKVLMMATDGLKSDVIFSIIQRRLSSEPELAKQMPFIIEINLTRNGHPIAAWILDTKTEGGRIYRYQLKKDGSIDSDNRIKTDAAITIDDNDLVAIMLGELNPQRVFISGRMKIRGNIMLLQRLNQFWKKIQTSRRGPDFPFVKKLLTDYKWQIKSNKTQTILLAT
ncbi:hydroxysteroid dehydrogenase-like protein, partial [Euroglyphus maynei]